jgi:hypothetical protein
MLNRNYFFSGWIENFGVVPWLLLAAFLFAPALVLLFFLLILVCFVFDAISKSLCSNLLNLLILRNKVLYFTPPYVKVFLLWFIVVTVPTSHCKNINGEQILLKHGQQHELKVCNFDTFSVGNKSTIAIKHRPRKCQLLIKAKAPGFSDLHLWKDGTKKTYNIQVFKVKVRDNPIISGLKSVGIKAQLLGDSLYIINEVDTISQYQLLRTLLKQNKVIFATGLSTRLRKTILEDIYQTIFKNGAENILCENKKFIFHCNISGISISDPSIKSLSKIYSIEFFNLEKQKSKRANFEVQFSVTKISSVIDQSSRKPLDSLNINTSALMNNQPDPISLNDIQISDNDAKVEVLATPTQYLTLGKKSTFKLGEEIPFQNTVNNQPVTQWVFAGLKISGLLKFEKGRFKWDGHVEISSPSGSRITKTSDRSSLYLTLGRTQKLFVLHLKGYNQNNLSSPILNKIPLISSLFNSHSSSKRKDYLLISINAKRNI